MKLHTQKNSSKSKAVAAIQSAKKDTTQKNGTSSCGKLVSAIQGEYSIQRQSGNSDFQNSARKKALIQREAEGQAGNTSSIHQAAQAGVQGSGKQMPHFTKIQQSFGSHDISKVQAYTSGTAAQASKSIGAEAYATGNKVAFTKSNPSLRIAAHEAAHTIQQQAGVQLQGGVGRVGDKYERHADAVADAVVQGKSAESLLDKFNSSAYRPDQSTQMNAPVQRLVGLEAELNVPVFAGGGATNDAKIRNFFGGGIVERKLLAPPNKGFKKVTDHGGVSTNITARLGQINAMLNTAKKAQIAPPAKEVAIMEYVTDTGGVPPAYDETTNAGRTAFRQSVKDMVLDMNAVVPASKAGVTALPAAVVANAEYGVPPVAVWNGFSAANNLNAPIVLNIRANIINAINDDLGVQMTAGVTLRRITKFLNKVGNDNSLIGGLTDTAPGGNNPAAWTRLVTRDAINIADAAVSHIDTGAVAPRFGPLGGPNVPVKANASIRNSKSLKGFVTLMISHIFGLYMQHRQNQLDGRVPNAKNSVAFLPRTPLTQLLRELDAAKRPDQWPAAQRNSLRDQIRNRVTAHLNGGPVNRIPADDAVVNGFINGAFDWRQWVDDMLTDPTNPDAIFNALGAIRRIAPHDHPNSKLITPVLGAAAKKNHPRPFKVKGVDKAYSGVAVSELRFIRGVRPGGLLGVVNNVMQKVRDSN